MKRIITLGLALCGIITTGFAQTDTTRSQTDTVPSQKPDTIKVGGMVIIREPGNDTYKKQDKVFRITHRHGDRPANISTNWWIFDFGFSNFNDKTIYSSADAQAFAPGSNDQTFNINTWKSRNINIWIFMQRINIVKHIVNLKYGLGLELNNYYYDNTTIQYLKNPPKIVYNPDYADLKKNKLAADYFTMPVMINFNFTPQKRNGYGISAGISAGYLYSSRQKIKMNDDIDKTKGDLGLNDWKLSWVGEIALGFVKLYGSYAFESMYDKGLDQTPYTFGLRFSNW